MRQETEKTFGHVVQKDRSLRELLDGDYTFLNERLAKHYGLTGVSGDEWRRVDGVRTQGRGGVLGFGATLAKQSGASRTSPILRGNWLSETLLGERLPRPPQGVPVLPEEAPVGLTERALTERHSSDPKCAGCHARIDPFGFALARDNLALKDLIDLGIIRPADEPNPPRAPMPRPRPRLPSRKPPPTSSRLKQTRKRRLTRRQPHSVGSSRKRRPQSVLPRQRSIRPPPTSSVQSKTSES